MRRAAIGLVVAAVCSCGIVLAQRPAAPPPAAPAVRAPAVEAPARPGAALPAAQANLADQQIAALLHGCCTNEIEISKWAESRLQSEAAKQFAQRMVRDHSPGCEVYQRLAGNLASAHASGTPAAAVREEEARPASPRTGEAPREGAAAPREGGVDVRVGGRTPGVAVDVKGHAGGLDWLSIHKQIGQQCLASTKKELGSKQGTEFDQCFVGQQLGAHMMVIDELQVLRNYASGELRQQIDKDLQAANEHLQAAKQLHDQVKGPSERVSRKPE